MHQCQCAQRHGLCGLRHLRIAQSPAAAAALGGGDTRGTVKYRKAEVEAAHCSVGSASARPEHSVSLSTSFRFWQVIGIGGRTPFGFW